jgi:superfamily II DNA or RNA helicase
MSARPARPHGERFASGRDARSTLEIKLSEPLAVIPPNTAIETYDGRSGVVERLVDTIAGVNYYRIAFGRERQDLAACDLFVPIESRPWTETVGPDAVRRIVTELKVESRARDSLASMSATTTKFFPYQYKPLIKLLRSPHERILVGDEVGLGKTIEAGFTLLEILARQPDASALIVCPPTLREKWRRELADRFGLSFTIMRSVEADRKVASGIRTESEGPLRAIVSYETIRRKDFRAALEGATSPFFDVLVVDEAHRARKAATSQSKAVALLASFSQKVVFLTATPIQTDAADLGRLLGILLPQEFPSDTVFKLRQRLNTPVIEAERAVNAGNPEALHAALEKLRALRESPHAAILTGNPSFEPTIAMLERLQDDLAAGTLSQQQSARRRIEAQTELFHINLLSPFFTRTRRADIEEDMPVRRAYPVTMALTEYESEIYHALSTAIYEEYARRYDDRLASLVIVGYQARLASSIAASVRHFREMLEASERADGVIADDDPNMDELLDDTAEEDGDEGEHDRERRVAPSSGPCSIVQCPAIASIVRRADLSRLEREDTKWRQLAEVLRDHMSVSDAKGRKRKMLLFSYYKRSLDLIGDHLSALHVKYERIDGDVPTCPEDPENDERQKRITRFREDPETSVLISSQVGTEGLDFQFCDTVVNWDLPWNPMTVEQRIGRIDRIGQESDTLHIVNIVCKGTVEWRILHRLYSRIRVFEESIGDVGEILGPIERSLQRDLMRITLTPDEMDHRIEANAKAAENQMDVARRVERESQALIGQDRFLVDEVARLKRAGKYLTPIELEHFVREQVRRIDAQAIITSDSDGWLVLHPGGQLLALLDDSLRRHRSPDWVRFASRMRRGPVHIAFDGGERERPKHVELVGAAHPLIRSLATRLETSAASARQFLARVESEIVPEGVWSLVVSVMKENSGTESDASVLCALARADGTTVDHDDLADDLLCAVVTTGEPWLDDQLDTNRRIAIAELGERAMRQKFAARRTERILEAERESARKQAVIAADFDGRAQRFREKISRAEEFHGGISTAEARILPVFRAQLANLTAKRDQQLARLASHARPSISATTLLVGIVKVSRPPTDRLRRASQAASHH